MSVPVPVLAPAWRQCRCGRRFFSVRASVCMECREGKGTKVLRAVRDDMGTLDFAAGVPLQRYGAPEPTQRPATVQVVPVVPDRPAGASAATMERPAQQRRPVPPCPAAPRAQERQATTTRTVAPSPPAAVPEPAKPPVPRSYPTSGPKAALIPLDRLDEWRADLQGGDTREAIAQRWGLTARQVKAWCTNRHVPAPPPAGRSESTPIPRAARAHLALAHRALHRAATTLSGDPLRVVRGVLEALGPLVHN
jgi:hypothetical protein